MSTEAQPNVTASRLKRRLDIYVRQATAQQVVENIESMGRQHALRQRALALGWPSQSVDTIDRDLERSSTSVTDARASRSF